MTGVTNFLEKEDNTKKLTILIQKKMELNKSVCYITYIKSFLTHYITIYNQFLSLQLKLSV